MRRIHPPSSHVSVLLAVFLSAAAGRQAAADPGVFEPGTDPGIGFNLISWYNNGANGSYDWETSVQDMYDVGFREVSLSPVRYVDVETGSILASSPKGAEVEHIEAAIVRAKSLGMKVTLNPFIEMYRTNGQVDPNNFEYFTSFNGCGWRGCFNLGAGTSENAQFWTSYQGYMVEMATLAQTHGVEKMTVGTEYNALNYDVDQNGNWNTLINAVDAAYQGQLGYASNWDVYNHPNVEAAIWQHPKIDFLGIDAYFNYGNDVLTGYLAAQNPGLDQQQAHQLAIDAANASGVYPNPTFIDLMTAAWNYKLDNEILPFAAAQKGGAGMPVMFTEVGYLPRNLTAVDPQHQYLTQYFGDQPVDSDEQIMSFEGLVSALDGRADAFDAIHIWQWWQVGTGDSLWNIDLPPEPGFDENPGHPSNFDQPDNVPLGEWLSRYVQNVPEPGSSMMIAVGLALLSCGRPRPAARKQR